MIPVKIQCGCGQKYAFEVELVDGRLPAPVACPVCGADGTAAANEFMVQNLPAQAVTIAARRAPLRVAKPSYAANLATAPGAHTAPWRGTSVLPGQVDRPQAEHEARAKISWGDPPEEVVKYLMIQSFSYEEASSFVNEVYRQRLLTVRGNGVRNIVIGVPLMCIPVGAWFSFLSIGIIPMKIFALTIMAGLWGAWMAVRGAIMLLAPKTKSGDVADE